MNWFRRKPEEPKYCVNCFWHRIAKHSPLRDIKLISIHSNTLRCKAPQNTCPPKIDLVKGEKIKGSGIFYTNCKTARMNFCGCGPKGKWFKQGDSE